MTEQNNTPRQVLECICPHCKQTIRIMRPQNPGRYKFMCTSCSTPFALTFKDEERKSEEEVSVPKKETTETATEDVVMVHKNNERYSTIGGLLEKSRRFFGKDKLHPLRLGTQYIGRTDASNPSDISLNDDTVSRQSVELTIEQHQDHQGVTYSYSINVHRQKNPVLHNGTPLQKGEVIVLHIGDVITVGKTKLTLK